MLYEVITAFREAFQLKSNYAAFQLANNFEFFAYRARPGWDASVVEEGETDGRPTVTLRFANRDARNNFV